ncbi:MAG: hypothetical protein LBH08_00545 [Puniceicoccales bacterium]|jgi:hypothetical protein|nr:hypothetical protein [Puniceicoccales bacterium]
MENFNFIIILGSFQKNTFAIVYSILECLDLPKLVHTPQSNDLSLQLTDFTEELTIRPFNWDNFIEFFQNESNSKGQNIVIMLSPKFNLAEQFQQLFHIHEYVPLNIIKIISIIDHCYFDGFHENLLDAMAHFSDILLIDNNPEIGHNRLKNFLNHCKQKECYPLPIKILSQYSVENIPELFDDRHRRMTLIFDDIDPIDLIEDSMADSTPFTIPTLAQRDKYLKKDDRGQYCISIEL